MASEKHDQQYWDNLYMRADTGWDIGYPSPSLQTYIDQLKDPHQSILIPGCGNSYEAEYLLGNGFTNITLVDIAPLLTEKLKKKFVIYLGKELKVITGDFFDLTGKYDLILEQTFLSALDPALRREYAHKMHELLKTGGKLVGVLFSREFEDGPPFGGSVEEYINLFEDFFEIKVMESCYNSIERRKGNEIFINLKAK